jgi:SET domain
VAAKIRKRYGLTVGAGVVAAIAVPKGALIHSWKGARVVRRPTYKSVQIGRHRHVLDPDCLNLLNHSCDPNVRIDIPRRTVVARRAIAKGELLTIFYPATEWEMARPFRCRCGAPGGLDRVRGAKHLSRSVLRGRGLSRHIRDLLRSRS